MRRIYDPYRTIIEGLNTVFDATGQVVTYISSCRSDGCYRFSDEYDRPGAHGYRYGLGTMTHSGYHYLDFIAYSLLHAPPSSEVVEARIVSRKTVGDLRARPSSASYRMVIGRDFDHQETQEFAGDNAEIEHNLYVSLRDRNETIPDCEVFFSFVHRGCTRRVSPTFPVDSAHDEGLTNDEVLVIHQGPLQSFHLLVSHDPSVAGQAFLARRLNPRMAEVLNRDPVEISSLTLDVGANTAKNREMVRNLLEVCAGRQAPEPYKPLAMKEQRTTMQLYALTMAAGHAPCSIPWEHRAAVLGEK